MSNTETPKATGTIRTAHRAVVDAHKSAAAALARVVRLDGSADVLASVVAAAKGAQWQSYRGMGSPVVWHNVEHQLVAAANLPEHGAPMADLFGRVEAVYASVQGHDIERDAAIAAVRAYADAIGAPIAPIAPKAKAPAKPRAPRKPRTPASAK